MLIRSTLLRMSSERKYFWSNQRYGAKSSPAREAACNSSRMPLRAGGNLTFTSLVFSSSEKVPFQNTCARLGAIRVPSRKRLSLYSKLILSSETGQAATADRKRRNTLEGNLRARLASRLAR